MVNLKTRKRRYELQFPLAPRQSRPLLIHYDLTFKLCNSVPYIQIVSVEASGNDVELFCLATVPGASCTKFLSGDFVGYAALDGDDTYAHVSNWRRGTVVSLYPRRYADSPDRHNSSLRHV